MNHTQAFSQLGVTLRNYRSAWSGIADDGSLVLTLWEDQVNAAQTEADCFDAKLDDITYRRRPGNIWRKADITATPNGRFRAIIAKAADPRAIPRRTVTRRIDDGWWTITSFNPETGEFRARRDA